MDESVLKRVMPNSREAEQSVIGAMIMDKDVISSVSEILVKDDFYYNQYGEIYGALVELYNNGKPIDVVTIQDKLKEKNVSPEVASAEYLSDLVMAVPSSVSAPAYANIVKSHSVKRQLIHLNQEIENMCYSGTEDVETILDQTEKKVFNVIQNRGASDFVPIQQAVQNAVDRISFISKQKSEVTGVSTGFKELNRKTAGLQPSDLVIIAARPAMGKTAFVLNVAEHVAVKQKQSVAIFSLEMSREQLVNRMLSLDSHVDAQKLRTGSLNISDWEAISESATNIAGSNLIIDDTPGITVSQLRSKCRKYAVENDLKLIIIDYLQLMQGDTKSRSESRQQEVSEISRALKGLARELNVPVVALSQLSRGVESRTDKRPMISDLRESGSIEQDADVVMFIYRDDYYNHDTDRPNVAEIIIAKQRHGPIGTVELAWIPEQTKFADLARTE